METLDTMLTSQRGEDKPQRRDHIQVFREFIDHLDRASRRKPPRPANDKKLKERRASKR